MTQGRVLSEAAVIARVNRELIPYRFNITETGWPDELPALKAWKGFYRVNFTSRFGFFAHVIIDPSGEIPLSTAGDGRREVFASSPCYQREGYLAFLDHGKAQHAALRELRGRQAEPGHALRLGGFKLRAIREIGRIYKASGAGQAPFASR